MFGTEGQCLQPVYRVRKCWEEVNISRIYLEFDRCIFYYMKPKLCPSLIIKRTWTVCLLKKMKRWSGFVYITHFSCIVFFFQGIIDQVQKHKLLFIETQDAAETSLALLNYQKVRFRHNFSPSIDITWWLKLMMHVTLIFNVTENWWHFIKCSYRKVVF